MVTVITSRPMTRDDLLVTAWCMFGVSMNAIKEAARRAKEGGDGSISSSLTVKYRPNTGHFTGGRDYHVLGKSDADVYFLELDMPDRVNGLDQRVKRGLQGAAAQLDVAHNKLAVLASDLRDLADLA